MAAVEQQGSQSMSRIFDDAAAMAERSGAFGKVEPRAEGVSCIALAQPEASFRIQHEGGKLYVCWLSPDRYLSQSIEADLMWTGDDLGELIHEELVDQGYKGAPLGRVEHFRDPEKRFTFRSLIPGAGAEPTTLLQCLLAYNAAFAELGDMKGEGEA